MIDYPLQEHWTRIGDGASAEVWALNEQRVLKLFHAQVNDVPIALEYEAGLWAEAQQIPIARPVGRVLFGDRSGILFERADGPNMLSIIVKRPVAMWRLVKRLARLHVRIHRAPGGAVLPRQIDVLRHRISGSVASQQARALALAQVEQLPQANQLVHGDYHPANLVLASRGPVVIDWAQATRGVPAADVARTELLLRFGGRQQDHASALAGVITSWWYRRCYAEYSGLSNAEIDAWRLPVAVAWQRGQLGKAQRPVAQWIERLTVQAVTA